MNCYFCAQRHPGGTNFGNSSAIGICQKCGVGVCSEHGQKKAIPSAPLLCFECIQLSVEPIIVQKPEQEPAKHLNLN